jgi:tetratricopeptide (TPR) repeat protein
MRPSTLDELLAPPQASDRSLSQTGVDAMADALLERLRAEDRVQAPERIAEPLTTQAEDAIHAWGVLCYEQGRYEDAAALFGAVRRRCPASIRQCMALGATHLARGDAIQAAREFAMAHQLDPCRADAVFQWAQSEYLSGRGSEASRLLCVARKLAQEAAWKWPDLPAWCDDLLMRIEPSSNPNPYTPPRSSP